MKSSCGKAASFASTDLTPSINDPCRKEKWSLEWFTHPWLQQFGDFNTATPLGEYAVSVPAAFKGYWMFRLHHCAIGVGHIGDKIEKLGALLGIGVRKIC
jgi:hypothetical protein